MIFLIVLHHAQCFYAMLSFLTIVNFPHIAFRADFMRTAHVQRYFRTYLRTVSAIRTKLCTIFTKSAIAANVRTLFTVTFTIHTNHACTIFTGSTVCTHDIDTVFADTTVFAIHTQTVAASVTILTPAFGTV